MEYIENINLDNKKVILRLDLNVTNKRRKNIRWYKNQKKYTNY